jgi:hypothetical protein
MATKTKGLGTILQAKISGTFTTIGQRMEIDGPDNSVGTKETTDLDSLAVERRATLPDGGELSIKVWFDPNDSTHATLAGWVSSPPAVTPSWKLIFPTTPTKSYPFDGVLTGFKPGGMTPDGYITADLKIAITGQVILT